jgi:hypothetical protein
MTDSNIETVSHCHQHVMTLKRDRQSSSCVVPVTKICTAPTEFAASVNIFVNDNSHLDKTDPYTGHLSFYKVSVFALIRGDPKVSVHFRELFNLFC